MRTPDTTLVQQAAFGAVAAAYAAGMRGTEFIAVCALAGVAIIGDALIRRGRAEVVAAEHYAGAGGDAEDE